MTTGSGRPRTLKGAEALTEVAVTEAMSQGKFGYPWMAEAERIVDSESGMQIQDPGVLIWFQAMRSTLIFFDRGLGLVTACWWLP